MTQLDSIISKLLVKYVNGEASAEEKQQLEEWASLSEGNSSWLEHFSNKNWYQQQLDLYCKIDLEERSKKFWSLVAAQQTQSSKPRKFKYNKIPRFIWKAAIIVIPILGSVAFFVLSNSKKINSAASWFNKKEAGKTINSNSQQTTANTRPNIIASSNSSWPATGGIQYKYASTNSAINQPEFHKVPIPPAGFRRVELPDGSWVWLNSKTDFVYPSIFNSDKRKVEITGEAYFEVVHNISMPFLIVANGVHIETDGGYFNIKAHKIDSFKKITVLRGIAKVTAGPHEEFVKEKQSAIIELNKPITIVQNEDIKRIIAWKKRTFLFKHDNTTTVLGELARWYDLTPIGNFNSKTLISYKGSRDDKISKVLKQMHRSNPKMNYSIKGKELRIE